MDDVTKIYIVFTSICFEKSKITKENQGITHFIRTYISYELAFFIIAWADTFDISFLNSPINLKAVVEF